MRHRLWLVSSLLATTWLNLFRSTIAIGLTTPTLPISRPPCRDDLASLGTDWARSVRIANRLEKQKYADVRARGRAGLPLEGPGLSQEPELSSSDVEEESEEEDTAQQEVQKGLWRACRTANIEGILLMLEAGADVQEPDPETDKRSPLHLAVITGALEPIEALIDAGARLDARADMGRPPLHFAVWPWECAKEGLDVPEATFSRHIQVVELLLARGANINMRDDFGVTALHTAARAGWAEMCKRLLSSGALVNANTVGGFTPLHHAAQAGRLACCRVLVHRGAGWDPEEEKGDDPLGLATMMEHQHVMALLQAWQRGKNRGGGRRRRGDRQEGRRAVLEESEGDTSSAGAMDWEEGEGEGGPTRKRERGRGGGGEWDLRPPKPPPSRKRRAANAPKLIT